MSEHLTRDELKRNELGEVLEKGIHYAEDHSRTIVIALAVALGLGLLAGGGVWWRSHRRAQANDLLARGLRVLEAQIVTAVPDPENLWKPTFATEIARRDKAEAIFTEVVDRFGGGEPGGSARLYLAQLAMERADPTRARALWNEVVEDDPTGPLAAPARVNLYRLDREAGKADAVVAEISRLLEQPERPLPNDLLLYQLALAYETLGKDGDAKATYRRIVDEHPQSPYLAVAQQKAGPAPRGA